MAASHENGHTYSMSFACPHDSIGTIITLTGVKANTWTKICELCDKTCNWSPKLKKWMSDADWREYRNDGRIAAGLDPECSDEELYRQHCEKCESCRRVEKFLGGSRCLEGRNLLLSVTNKNFVSEP